jgi:hypothetical protein
MYKFGAQLNGDDGGVVVSVDSAANAVARLDENGLNASYGQIACSSQARRACADYQN